MPLQFSFDASYLTTAPYIDRGNFSTGRSSTFPGLDYPTYYSAIAPNQSIATSGGVDVFAMTMVAGQTYKLDIDSGAIDLEIDIIDASGKLIRTADNFNGDMNPFLSFTAGLTGTYYIAVHHASNDYVDGSFQFEGTAGPRGSYKFAVSTPSIGSVVTLSDYSESRSYSDAAQTVRALGGNDTIVLNGGNDIGVGGAGSDSLFGGYGSDELSGGSGSDRLDGGAGDDVLQGGHNADRLFGGSERDGLFGGSGNDLLQGGTGNDTLWGDTGSDTIYGESGNDFIRGGEGLDVLYGGTGADTFHFLPGEAPASSYAAEDRIEDFQIGDTIDLSDLAWGRLAWRGTAGFTSAGREVTIVKLQSGYIDVRVNTDTDTTIEFEVLVKTAGSFNLIADDFIL